MQETANKQKRMADDMDINLEVFNLETDFFGDLHCSSRFTDILCEAQAQYGDYSELEKCPMWGKEGEGAGRRKNIFSMFHAMWTPKLYFKEKYDSICLKVNYRMTDEGTVDAVDKIKLFDVEEGDTK